jgi:hypothetical protein
MSPVQMSPMTHTEVIEVISAQKEAQTTVKAANVASEAKGETSDLVPFWLRRPKRQKPETAIPVNQCTPVFCNQPPSCSSSNRRCRGFSACLDLRMARECHERGLGAGQNTPSTNFPTQWRNQPPTVCAPPLAHRNTLDHRWTRFPFIMVSTLAGTVVHCLIVYARSLCIVTSQGGWTVLA